MAILIDLTNVARADDLTTLAGRVTYLETHPETIITVVANYAALPSAALHTGEFYWVENATGTSWLPGSLGGTYRQTGLYYSNGVDWEFTPSAYQATQGEVDAGTADSKFVTPLTLSSSTYIKDFTWTFDFIDNQTLSTYSGFVPFKINSITINNGAPLITILVNSVAYVLGATIPLNAKLDITASIASVITLNCTEI